MLTTCEKRLLATMAKLLCFTPVTTIILTRLCVFPITTLAQTAGLDQSPPPPLGKLVDVGTIEFISIARATGVPLSS
jgi:hypothetical protein